MTDSIILELRNITKFFPGVTALDNVSLKIRRGEIHALVGENGAGKSTMIKILCGAMRATSGNFFLNGKPADFLNPIQAMESGISTVHQELKLVNTLTVAENIFLGHPVISGPFKLVNQKLQNNKARELLVSLNINLDENAFINGLSVAQKQLVEICKALSQNTNIVILDEPSATLTDNELDILFKTLETLRGRGVTILYISHRLEEIFRIAERVTVLRDGKVIDTLEVNKVDRKKLIEMMVGRSLESEYPKQNVPMGKILLEIKDFSRGNSFKNINLTLHRGEILGIAGLVGAGRTELVRAIFGADKKNTGTMRINGKKADIRNVPLAISHGIGLVPEERKTQGLVLGMSVKENISLAGLDKVLKKSVINTALESELAKKYISMLRIVPAFENREVRQLSGGNQQKVVLAKWLALDSDVLLFDEPTRGIDVGAKVEIYNLLTKMASAGKGIIMVSSELPELIGMCDNILVMHEGYLTGVVKAKYASQELIMEYATRHVSEQEV
jgi:ABC-type sugar transport system ATPase subunit